MKYLILILLSTLSLQIFAAESATGKIEGVTAEIPTDFRAFKLQGVTPPCDTQYRWIIVDTTGQQRSEIWSMILSAYATQRDVELRYDGTTCKVITIFLW